MVPFETGVGEGYFVSRPVDQRPKGRNLPSLTDRVGRHKSGYRRRVRRIICCFDEPSGDIVERLPAFRAMCKKRLQVRFLLLVLPRRAEIRGVPADICFATLILEVDLGLIQWRIKKVFDKYLPPGPGRWADGQEGKGVW